MERYPKEYMEGRRPVGRPGRRVARDAKRMLKYRNWRRSAEDRDACKWGIGEAKTQVGL